jgi:hypothetical protein
VPAGPLFREDVGRVGHGVLRQGAVLGLPVGGGAALGVAALVERTARSQPWKLLREW